MNFDLPVKKMSNPDREGSVLIVAVWMLAVLFIMTMALSRVSGQQLKYAKLSVQKAQARYSAWAGVIYVTDMVRQDSLDETTKNSDNLYTCGFKLPEGKIPENLFNNIVLSRGGFTVTSPVNSDNGQNPIYGPGDEDGKINLNALSSQSMGVFRELLKSEGVPDEQALRMAADAADWRDEDNEPVMGKSKGQDEEGPYHWLKDKLPAKNRPFDSIAELRFIENMTPELYDKIKNVVTIFPKKPERLQVNLATAPREVIKSLARYYSGPQTNTSATDADGLTVKILLQRSGPDRIDATADDQPLNEQLLGLNMAEAAIFRAMNQAQAKISRFLSVHVAGTDPSGQKTSRIDAVIDRQNLAIVSWRMD